MTCFKLIHFNYVIRNLFTIGVIKNSNITHIKSKNIFYNINNALVVIFNFYKFIMSAYCKRSLVCLSGKNQADHTCY